MILLLLVNERLVIQMSKKVKNNTEAELFEPKISSSDLPSDLRVYFDDKFEPRVEEYNPSFNFWHLTILNNTIAELRWDSTLDLKSEYANLIKNSSVNEILFLNKEEVLQQKVVVNEKSLMLKNVEDASRIVDLVNLMLYVAKLSKIFVTSRDPRVGALKVLTVIVTNFLDSIAPTLLKMIPSALISRYSENVIVDLIWQVFLLVTKAQTFVKNVQAICK